MRRRAALLSTLWVVAALLPAVHQLGAQHQTCALHGEVVEADALPREPRALQRGPGLDKAPPQAEAAHQHCVALALLGRGLLCEATGAAAPPPPPALSPAAPRAVAPLLALRLYRLAPKGSPPAAA